MEIREKHWLAEVSRSGRLRKERPITKALRDALFEGIRSGDLVSGSQLATIQQMARALGCTGGRVVVARKQLAQEGLIAMRGSGLPAVVTDKAVEEAKRAGNGGAP